MGRKNKLRRFAELLTFPNVFENFNPGELKLIGENGMEVEFAGKWRTAYFGNPNPVTLELACGKAEFLIAMAEKYPNINFIGIDIKGDRIWKGAKRALESNMRNVAFVRTRIEQIDKFFSKNEIDEIWITFPDPFIKKSQINRRLTSPKFITIYKEILKPGSTIHIKTDSMKFFKYTLDLIQNRKDISLEYSNPSIYQSNILFDDLKFQTYYEKMHLSEGKDIKYIKFII